LHHSSHHSDPFQFLFAGDLHPSTFTSVDGTEDATSRDDAFPVTTPNQALALPYLPQDQLNADTTADLQNRNSLHHVTTQRAQT
jgi:hypothetical protein